MAFLAGGGEMGAAIRAFDWAKTPLGPAQTWPQSLRSPLSMMLPSKAQICLFWGPEYVVIYNDAYRPVFGAKHPHVLGRPGRVAWSEVWDAGTGLHALLDGVVKTGEAFSARDLRFFLERHGFAEETYFDVSYDPVRDESGQVGGVFCIVTETTGRVVGERRLALLRELAAHTGARTPREACAVAMQTVAARPDDVPFALAWLGEELQGCTPGAQRALAATRPEHTAELAIAPSGGTPAGRLVVGLNARLPYDEKYRAFLDLTCVQLATAIASASAYEQETKRAEALAEIDRAKTAFFSNVSHEFRTPLTLMLGPLEELLSRDAHPDRELLGVVHRNGQRLLKLVNTLLDFARIEAGRMQASYEPVDLAALSADLASCFRAACQKAGLQLQVDCPRGVQAWVDREMWEKVVLNLLSNAFKFTLQGGITVQVQDGGQCVRLIVRDTGTGIPPEALGRVFDRFERIEGARGRSHEGSGIGLALVQELVRLHGGTIAVASELERGTVFTVQIPKGAAHLPADRLKPAAQAQPSARADTYVSEALGWLGDAPAEAARGALAGGARILVADDNADLREYARHLLGEQFDVQTVSDGLAALAAVRARRPELVISDVMMPGLDGFGLIRELRKDPDLAAIPVILLSARAGEEARLEGLQRGADDYLVKPFSARGLLGSVAAVLQAETSRRRQLEYEMRFRSFVQAGADAVYTMSPDWSEIRHLQGQRFSADQHEPNRSWLRRYVHPDDQAQVLAAVEAAIRNRSVFQLEHRVLRADGSLGWTFSRAMPILAADGSIAEWLGAASDISARKQAESALLEADLRKDEFLATLAHELRSPLAPLRNALNVMQLRGSDDSTPLRDIMERQLNHLVRLVDDLLELSSIRRGVLELRREQIELATVVRNAVETCEPLIRAARHQLEVALPDEELWLEGDPVRIAQILSNLLNNAVKYTAEGGSIGLVVRRQGECTVMSVRDNGVGISREGLSRIFEMFSREGREAAHSQGGLGIGLTLARRLAELHGGTLQAHSEGEGCGSEFTLRLPLAPAPRRPRPLQRVRAASAEPVQICAGLRILIVDDDRDSAESLAMALELLGADVYVAYDGPGGIEIFCAKAPEIVLLDIGMPDMDGYEVARALRTRFADHRPTLVALTGWGQEADRRRARAAGFDHHIVKPVTMQELRALLSGIASRTLPAR